MNYSQNGNQQTETGEDASLDLLWRKKDMEIQAEQVKKQIEIQAKQMIEDGRTMSIIQRTKDLADVASKKELQRTILTFSEEHDVILQKECFGDSIKGMLPIKILRSIVFCHERDIERRVLYILVRKNNGKEVVLYWDTGKSETRWIRKVFEVAGISFGFGEKKETEIRRMILLTAVNTAETMILSERHGWHQLDGKWQYAFPEELTWMEVNQRC